MNVLAGSHYVALNLNKKISKSSLGGKLFNFTVISMRIHRGKIIKIYFEIVSKLFTPLPAFVALLEWQ